MTSREGKKEALQEQWKQLRSLTNSTSVNKTSIIVDASKYIEQLQEKVQKLNLDIATSSNSSDQNSWPMEVTVETQEKRFLINVFSQNDCPGLLVFILEAFEELGLDVLDANVSCSDNFQLQATGAENEGQEGSIDAQAVKQGVLEAIQKWSEND